MCKILKDSDCVMAHIVGLKYLLMRVDSVFLSLPQPEGIGYLVPQGKQNTSLL